MRQEAKGGSLPLVSDSESEWLYLCEPPDEELHRSMARPLLAKKAFFRSLFHDKV
jgi:hypothetical protein